MRTFDIREAKARLSRLIEQAAQGESFVIAKAGKPLVKVVALTPNVSRTKRLGFLSGQITVPDDFDRLGTAEIETRFLGES